MKIEVNPVSCDCILCGGQGDMHRFAVTVKEGSMLRLLKFPTSEELAVCSKCDAAGALVLDVARFSYPMDQVNRSSYPVYQSVFSGWYCSKSTGFNCDHARDSEGVLFEHIHWTCKSCGWEFVTECKDRTEAMKDV